MNTADPDRLPPEAELALVWSPPKVRAPLTMALRLDRRLSRIVARTSEPMLGQMRLAWWREALTKPIGERPCGDEVLDGLGAAWGGREASLIAMIDAWEVLVTAQSLGAEAIEAFGSGRGAFFAALDDACGYERAGRAAAAGFRWAIADAATAVSDSAERGRLIAAGLAHDIPSERLPRSLRGLAVLEALSLRSLRRGGLPLMQGRGASLTALRAAIFLG
jgi:15-cis-phytoene synthase